MAHGVDYVDISWRFATRGHQTREGWVKSAVFYLYMYVLTY